MKTRRNFIQKSIFATSGLLFSRIIFARPDKLPNVLIIGDSISIGYTPFVQEMLMYKAKVIRPMQDNNKAENCAGTTKGVANIDRWLGETQWDVIHFNFGLHDLKHVDPSTGENSKNPDHPHQANPKQYKTNLKEIVEKLKATGAKLIFATTTPYPDEVGGPLRKPGMPARYNKAAVKIMNKNDIRINDLHAFVIPRIAEIQKPNNVHFTQMGSRALAEKVAARIEELL